MKTTRRQYLHQLTFLPRLLPVNCYLIEEEGELTLVDAALPFAAKGILGAAALLKKPITRIVLTHAHNDHVGSLDALKDAFPDARVFISLRDARLLAGDRSLDPREADTPIRGGLPKHLKTVPDRLLQDGDRVGSLLVVSAPGHTPGSIALFDSRTRALIAGDAFQTRGGLAVSGRLRPLFPLPALATWSKEAAVQSAYRLAAMRPSLLAVGHGKMITDPTQAMEGAIARAERTVGTFRKEKRA